MNTSTLPLLLSSVCQQSVIPSVESTAAWIWFAIKSLWPWYWLLIVVLLIAWIIFEIATRHGGAHYNSQNGFSPLFNSFVGSGTYALLQYLTYLALKKPFGPGVYCHPWSYLIHLTIFYQLVVCCGCLGFGFTGNYRAGGGADSGFGVIVDK